MTLEQAKRKLKKVQEELDKIGIDTAQNYGWGTQRLGHAQRKREELAKEKFKLRQLIDELENMGLTSNLHAKQ